MTKEFSADDLNLIVQEDGQKSYLEFSFMPCVQSEEDLLNTNVVCASEQDVLEYFGNSVDTNGKVVSRGFAFSWSDKFVAADQTEMEASPVTETQGSDAFYLTTKITTEIHSIAST